jgi:hypothetical protein
VCPSDLSSTNSKTHDILQVSRLRDTLECPESSYYFVDDEIARLPDHLLRDTPMSDFLAVGLERLMNDPNRKENERLGLESVPTGRPIAFEGQVYL